jgi:hypothetical protein
MPTGTDPRTGQPIRLPYPGEPGYQGPGGGGGGQAFNPSGGIGGPNLRRPQLGGSPIGGPQGIQRRRPGGQRPPQGKPPGQPPRTGGGSPPMPGGGRGVAPPQMAMNQPAEVGTPMQDIGNFGAMGAMPGIGEQGAVNAGSNLNLPKQRRRGGLV